jgi:hypothetical protein
MAAEGREADGLRAGIALTQGGWYSATGVLPFLSRRAFEAVTGKKTDFWLVRTVGSLVGVLGAQLVAAGRARRVPDELAKVAAASAAALAAIEVGYVARRRISLVYLADAVLEVGLVAAWAIALRRSEAAR